LPFLSHEEAASRLDYSSELALAGMRGTFTVGNVGDENADGEVVRRAACKTVTIEVMEEI